METTPPAAGGAILAVRGNSPLSELAPPKALPSAIRVFSPPTHTTAAHSLDVGLIRTSVTDRMLPFWRSRRHRASGYA